MLSQSARFLIEARETVGETKGDVATRSSNAIVVAARTGGVAIGIGIARASFISQ
jgi:hypothetical protein